MVTSHFFKHDTAVVETGAQIGTGTAIWHFTHIMPHCVIGNNCILGQNVFIDNNVHIGNNVKIQNNVSVYNSVTLEEDVFIGPSAVFTNVINPRSFIERKSEFKATLVKKGCTIGANATILCGITIGNYAFIGAGTVVTRNVKDFALITGNPGKQTGWMSKAGHKLVFKNNSNEAICPETGQTYLLIDENLYLQKLI